MRSPILTLHHITHKSKAIVLPESASAARSSHTHRVLEQSIAAIAGDFCSREWSLKSSEEFSWSDLQMSRWMIHTSDEVFQPIESTGRFRPTQPPFFSSSFSLEYTNEHIHRGLMLMDGWMDTLRSSSECQYSVAKFYEPLVYHFKRNTFRSWEGLNMYLFRCLIIVYKLMYTTISL